MLIPIELPTGLTNLTACLSNVKADTFPGQDNDSCCQYDLSEMMNTILFLATNRGGRPSPFCSQENDRYKVGLKVMMMISNLKHRMVIKLKICRDPIQPLTPLTKLYCEFKHPADSPTNIRRFLAADTIA